MVEAYILIQIEVGKATEVAQEVAATQGVKVAPREGPHRLGASVQRGSNQALR